MVEPLEDEAEEVAVVVELSPLLAGVDELLAASLFFAPPELL